MNTASFFANKSQLVILSVADLEAVINTTAEKAAELAVKAAVHDKPAQMNYTQAAKVLNVCRQTVANMCQTGQIRLNAAGRIPKSEIERVLSVRR